MSNERKFASGKPGEVSLFQKQEWANFCRRVIVTVGLYLAEGIEMSYKEAGIKKGDFWRNLFPEKDNQKKSSQEPNESKKPSILEDRGKTKKDRVPERPCWDMDYQACTKYIAFGSDRKNDDSVHFCRRFNVGLSRMPVEGADEFKAFREIANGCVWIRNDYMHITRTDLMKMTPNKVWRDIRKLKDLTEPMNRAQQIEGVSFGELPRLEEFWESVLLQCRNLMDTEPIPVEHLGEELFYVEELSEDLREKLIGGLAYLGISEENGRIHEDVIYKEPSRVDLLGKLRYAIRQLERGEEDEGPESCEQKWREEKAAQKAERERQYPVLKQPVRPTYTSAGLEFTRESAKLDSAEIETLINRFNILLDGSVFLNSDGRNGIEKILIPSLKRTREKVLAEKSGDSEEIERKVRKTFAKMYNSSIGELFRLLRETRPLTDDELESWGEEAEEEQANRASVRDSCKKGIGRTLAALKRENCLTVSPCLVDEESTYENFCRLAEKFPEKLLLVITCSESLAAELGKVGAQNVVAARFVRKTSHDFFLQIFDATQQNWVDIMGVGAGPSDPDGKPDAYNERETELEKLNQNMMELTGEADVPRQKDAVHVVLPEISDMKDSGLTGMPMTVMGPDGSAVEITLGERIGFGGEGTIYAVSEPESYTHTAVKIYKEGQRTKGRLDKLNYMLANDPEIDGLCWPSGLVCEKAGKWIGFLMPLAKGEPLAYTVYNLGENAANIREKLGWDRKALVMAAAKIAEMFGHMHQHGILMGDINPRNILVSRDCRVWFVDCDSYQVGDFPCPVGMMQYIPPEVLREQKPGEVDYSYRRTEANEQYSLSVLLFEVLMLGKPPYVSRNNNARDIREAVLEGIFPYRFNGEEGDGYFDEDDEEEARRRLERRGLLAPAGVWKMIWSNTTHRVKKAFYNTFKNGERHTAWEWKKIMEQYAFEIGQDHADSDLIPRSYKIPADEEVGWGICADCGERVRMLKRDLEMRKAQGRPVYCYQHHEERQFFKEYRALAQCEKCGKFYSEKAIYLVRPNFKPLCGHCSQEDVLCACCGERFRIESMKKAELKEQGKAFYCDSCLYVSAVCGDCNKQIRVPRFRYEKLCKEKKEIWCDDCRQRRLAK